MEFVYPPKPRGWARDQQDQDEPDDEDEENIRGFSPGPSWLEKMLVDLEHGRKDLVGDIEDLKQEAQTVLYDVIRLRILLDREQASTKNFVGWMRGVVGEEVVNTIIEEATQAAEDRTSDEEDDGEEGEEEVERERDGEQQANGEDHEELDDYT
jgi:septin family protein